MRIELKNIYKSFNKKVNTIENLSLTIEDGDFVALLGPSGCGKTTTMLMIAGIYKPNSGAVYFENEIVNELEPKDRQIGMVFQSYALYPHMTVLDNICFPLKQQKVENSEMNKRAKEAANMVKLGHLIDRMPSQLSGGQQQRVALARAIVKRPKILLLDEPLSNLDARLKVEMRAEISRIQKELGITTILVTHDQEEAMTMADKVAVMKEGEIIQYSAPMDLYHHPKDYFVAQFIGTPPMNFIGGMLQIDETRKKASLRVQDKSIPIDFNSLNISNNAVLDVYVGIRPHELQLGNTKDITFRGKVNLVEPIGHSKMVVVEIDEDHVRFFVDAYQQIYDGSEVEVCTHLSSLQLFDRETGRNIMNKEFAKQKGE